MGRRGAYALFWLGELGGIMDRKEKLDMLRKLSEKELTKKFLIPLFECERMGAYDCFGDQCHRAGPRIILYVYAADWGYNPGDGDAADAFHHPACLPISFR